MGTFVRDLRNQRRGIRCDNPSTRDETVPEFEPGIASPMRNPPTPCATKGRQDGSEERRGRPNANHPKKGMKESVATAAAKSVLAFFLLMGNLLCDRASSKAILASRSRNETAGQARVAGTPPSREADDSESGLIPQLRGCACA